MTDREHLRRAGLGAALVALGLISARTAPAQEVPAPAPAPTLAPAPAAGPVRPLTALPAPAPGTAVVGGPVLAEDVQVVRFSVPEGTRLEVLGPPAEPLTVADAQSAGLTFGLRVGVAYRLKLSNLPNAPGGELFPEVELVGHLHRPPGIDPMKFPIRIPFSFEDLDDAAVKGRLVTQYVYLEDPDQALPISFPKDQIPVVTLSPAESPLKVAAALGRTVAIVKVGGRAPTPDELTGAGDYTFPNMPCPFIGPEGGKCSLPCGPVCGTPPPPGRPWLPKDEFLCDGGDGGAPMSFGGDGGLQGIDPRDAAIRFQADNRPRVLPTNRVCIYAPRFAAVRASIGANQNLIIENLYVANLTERMDAINAKQGPKKFTQNERAAMGRHRARPTVAKGRQYAGDHVEIRVLQGFDASVNIAGNVLVQGPEFANSREMANLFRLREKLNAVKTAETAVVTGIAEGLGQNVMAWKPQEMVGVEVPPDKPGLAVVKQVDTGEAEPGDTVEFTIFYRNMGNVPILNVSVIDSLLPRLEYVPRSALGPAGTVFSANENRVGSTELRWDLPKPVAPGEEGYVRFKAKVR